ncbi:MAG: hypothetical protein WDM81_07500 [Rhizomicrobium sp.]
MNGAVASRSRAGADLGHALLHPHRFPARPVRHGGRGGADPVVRLDGAARLRWPVLAAALVFETAIGAAAAPYLLTGSGRAEAARSIGATWHICKVIVGAG